MRTARYVFDKLFGGPLNGKRVALDEGRQGVVFPRMKRMRFQPMDLFVDQEVHYKEEVYTQRRMAFKAGDDIHEILYYAHSKLDDSEAALRLFTHFMRDARCIS